MLKVKGTMVYPPAIEGVINGFVPRVTGEFRIVLDEPPPRVVPPLKLKVEYGESLKEDALESLAEEIGEEMHRRIKIRPKIIWIPPKTLERFVGLLYSLPPARAQHRAGRKPGGRRQVHLHAAACSHGACGPGNSTFI